MDFVITPVLLLLDERMKHLELNMGTVGVGHNAGTSYTKALEDTWQVQLR